MTLSMGCAILMPSRHRIKFLGLGLWVLGIWLLSPVTSSQAQATLDTTTITDEQALPPAPWPRPDASDPSAAAGGHAGVEVALLQGLDKITARVSTFEAPIGVAVQFGSLSITTRACNKRPPEEPPESASFLEIVDIRPDSPSVQVFTGWMFASSPALSALEHPVYDVWVVDCKNASNKPSSSDSGN